MSIPIISTSFSLLAAIAKSPVPVATSKIFDYLQDDENIVFEEEPIKKTNKLSRLENVVLLPHIGSSTHETRLVMADITVKNLILGLEGKRLLYSV